MTPKDFKIESDKYTKKLRLYLDKLLVNGKINNETYSRSIKLWDKIERKAFVSGMFRDYVYAFMSSGSYNALMKVLSNFVHEPDEVASDLLYGAAGVYSDYLLPSV